MGDNNNSSSNNDSRVRPPPQPATATGYPATAHPYPAPPPNYNNSNYNPYNYNPPPPPPLYPDPRATLLRRILAAIIASIIIIGTLTFIIWLVLRPKLPTFQVDSLSLSNFNLSSSSSSSSLITGNWDIRLTSRNPNSKITLFYDRIQAGVYYDDVSISETSLAPFSQGKKDQTALKATFVAAGSYIGDKAGDGISRDKGKGSVEFNLRMVARVRFRAGFWRTRRRWLRVYCGDLVVGVKGNARGNGSLLGGPKGCRVGL